MNPLIRTYIYIDAFNLYYGQLKGKPGKWLDIECKFLSHQVNMPRCDGKGNVCVVKTEEKMTDVNIAVHILNDAYLNKFDLAVLISNDSDLAEPLKLVQSMGKKIGILNPQKNTSKELSKYTLFQKKIRHNTILISQLPLNLTDAQGRVIHKPKEWA